MSEGGAGMGELVAGAGTVGGSAPDLKAFGLAVNALLNGYVKEAPGINGSKLVPAGSPLWHVSETYMAHSLLDYVP